MFSVEQMTGIVRINKSLQRDKAAVVSMTIKAMDIFGGKEQTGTGYNEWYEVKSNEHCKIKWWANSVLIIVIIL